MSTAAPANNPRPTPQEAPLDDVCYHFPCDDDPEELYIVRVLNPALVCPQEFSAYVTELCRGLES